MKLSPQAQALLNQANANSENVIKRLKDTENATERKDKKKEEPEKNIPETTKNVETETDSEFPFTMKIRGKELHFRSWKVKDMKNYKNAEEISGQRKALVYDCIKEDNALDSFEYLYALIQIRQKSIQEKIKYNFKCTECEQFYEAEVDLSDIVHTDYKEYAPFTIGEHTYEFSDIKNRDYYESMEHSELIDLIMHVDNIDGDKSLTLEEVTTFFDELPIQEFIEIKEKYNEQRFKVEMKGKVKCSHCGNEVNMIFDTLPNFVPPEFEA